jgi:hypothetical protein
MFQLRAPKDAHGVAFLTASDRIPVPAAEVPVERDVHGDGIRAR